MMRKVIVTLLICLAILLSIEVYLRLDLFNHVLYSNSESIDRQLKDRDGRSDWNILFVGDSETRWGINPAEIDNGFRAREISAVTFNHAFDGFGASWWPGLLPTLLESPSLKEVKYVVVGVQLMDVHRVVSNTGEDCGALQRPVLSSPFAIDLGLDGLCQDKRDWDALFGKRLFNKSWIVRYSSAVRSLIMPSFMDDTGTGQLRFNSRKSGEPLNGFVPHHSIAVDSENYDDEFSRWKAQYVPERDFKPLPEGVWESQIASSGFFDQLNDVVKSTGRQLVLYALPTNPVLIDTFNRRSDYLKNSQLLQQWASQSGVVFIDMGIQDNVNAEVYFSDMRHLSGIGANQYSKLLGEMLAKSGVLDSSKAKISGIGGNL